MKTIFLIRDNKGSSKKRETKSQKKQNKKAKKIHKNLNLIIIIKLHHVF